MFQADEIYWPKENETLTIGHTVVTHKATEVKDGIIRITMGTQRFGKVDQNIIM